MIYIPTLMTPKTVEEIKSTNVAELRRQFIKLNETYEKLYNGNLIYCNKCDKFYPRGTYYSSKDFASGIYPICKKCLIDEATDYNKSTKKHTDNKEKTKKVLKKMNLPFYESLYLSNLDSVKNEINEKNYGTAWQHYMTIIKSLPQYQHDTWEDSEFSDDDGEFSSTKENIRSPRKEIKKIFGSGFSTEDYLYLQDQYDDWRKRTEIDSKPQETYIIRICFKLLDIWKAQKSGKDTKDLDRSLNELMNASNLQPKQNTTNFVNDSLTFGQLIEKWEQEEPIPEPTDEFKDVDGIGKYIRVWFKGYLGRALGLENVFTREFEEEISKYTVEKQEYAEEENSDDIYGKLFGKQGD